MIKKFVLGCALAGIMAALAFAPGGKGYNEAVASYYNHNLDSLIRKLQSLESEAKRAPANKASLKRRFLSCREAYKKVSFFLEQFDSRNARAVNGPDLLRIEDDTQQDSTKPHGFQHIEAILYAPAFDAKSFRVETGILLKTVQSLRTAPDHEYYFRDDRVWEALRSGTYRIISLGITGFDVPMSLNALPETRRQLAAEREVLGFYKKSLDERQHNLYDAATKAFDAAILFVEKAKEFNSFDRLRFIRDYINPLTACLKDCAFALGAVNGAQLTPLNAEAENLFSKDIFNIAFFSPNERFLPTAERISLGKRLFSDTRLSRGNVRSCASCHQPERAFTDGISKALSLDGKTSVARNTPTLINSAIQARQFYDSRALVLETQLDAVVHNQAEMGGSLCDAVPLLAADTAYSRQFAQAYSREREKINQYTIANAIGAYIRSLTSLNSRFDRYMRHESADFSGAEQRGFNLFMGKAKCGTCHYAPVFNSLVPPRYEESESEILAVPALAKRPSALDDDLGKGGATHTPLHNYAFKTPTVRNAALTAPYMHNGVFKTLEEVVDFYNRSGGNGWGIHLEAQTLPLEPLHLSAREQRDIVAFLRSLNDTGH